MKSLRGLGFIFFISALFLPLAWGHHAPFNSLSEVETHINGHFAELQVLQRQNPTDKVRVREKCREIQIHAKEYQQFSRELIIRGEHVQMAQVLNKISEQVYTAAVHEEFLSVVENMGKLKNLLSQPA